ncbi:MAG: excinuclease ABC subunit C [Flavobacteriaceae bacterium]|nr:MAG: excinuclease ABC subunit C [Flavobacteriaceae bacterium]
MKHFLYIIYSKTLDKFYIGETPNIQNRIQQHNQHYFKTNFTKSANDWSIVLSKKCDSKENAIYLEKFVKRMKSKKFVLKLIANPQILDDLLNKR